MAIESDQKHPIITKNIIKIKNTILKTSSIHKFRMKKTTSKGRHHKRSVSANIVNYQKDNSIALNQWNNVVRRIDNLKSNINSLIKCK